MLGCQTKKKNSQDWVHVVVYSGFLDFKSDNNQNVSFFTLLKRNVLFHSVATEKVT